ncbi:MAG: hypothetical protein NWE89_02225 [Candidatus Bathyarchaeota archaeon]|nr:hypothetical protein [Candidatus Bathyarchaeota archaeon]
MKCIWHWKQKIDPYKDDEYRKVGQKVQKAMEEYPDEFPKMGNAMHTANGEGFRLVEGTQEQMANLVAIWSPVDEWKLEVYFECPGFNKVIQRWRSYK